MMPRLARHLLWIDCGAGALAGIAVLALRSWLTGFYGLPGHVLSFVAGANLCYAAFSFTLAARSRRPRSLIVALVSANLAWSAICVGLAVAFWQSATVFGLAQLLGEAAFVGVLASGEWRWRDELARPARIETR
jgi:hypothetical protein